MIFFEIEQIRSKFKENNFPVNELMEKFWRIDSYGTVLSSSLVLDALINFLEKRNGNIHFTKFEFYKYFIEEITEGDTEYRQKIWDLSLELERRQVNGLVGIEMTNLLSEINIDKQKLLDDGLFVVNNDVIGFFHHTISEFLVADKWIIENKVKEYLDGLLIKNEGEIFAVNNSWYGVLRFLLDSQKWREVYEWMLYVANKNPSAVDEGFSDTITSIDPNNLNEDEKSKIFQLIFQTYLLKKTWIPLWTRNTLPNFCQTEDYQKMKLIITDSKGSETDNLINLGNTLDVIGRMLTAGSPLIKKDRLWWKTKLVSLANIENGVIQRHALSALSSYVGESNLVNQVTNLLTHKSNLVREAYLDFCSDVDPNSDIVINKMVDGLKAGEEIYSRHGLYKINNKRGIQFLLVKLVSDSKFLKLFLDKESIFNGHDRNGDEAIICNIRKYANDKDIQNFVKKIIKNSLEDREIYHQNQSYFIRSLVLLAKEFDPGYVSETLEYLSKTDGDKSMRVYDYIPFLVWIIDFNNVNVIYEKLSNIDERSGRFAQQAIYQTRFEGDSGLIAYEEAVKKGLVTAVEEKDWKLEQDKKVYKEFKKYLGNIKKKTYFPTVFQYFHHNEKILRKIWKPVEEERLKWLVIEEGLKKIDPKKFDLKIIKNDEGKRVNQYSISRVASYFGDVIEVARLLELEINKATRQNIIDFIPFAYSDDWQAIKETVGQVSDSELSWINTQYIKRTDIKYFLPDSYIYFVRNAAEKGWGLVTPIKTLKSIAEDSGISDQDRTYALEVLSKYIDKTNAEFYSWLQSDFNCDKTQKVADDLLISVFKDRSTIERRINKIKEFARKARDFEEELGVHSVGDMEDELMEMHLANPIFNLGLEKYSIKILGLLDFSADILDSLGRNNVPSSVNYLWRIVFGFVTKLDSEYSKPLLKLIDEWIRSNSEIDGLNWVQYNFEKARSELVRKIPHEKIGQTLSSVSIEPVQSGNNVPVVNNYYLTIIKDSKIEEAIISSPNSSIVKKSGINL